MSSNPSYRHIFHGHAYAAGGFVSRPIHATINVPASSSLPPDGGYQSAQAGPYNLENLIRFDAAYTQVAGSLDSDGTFTTLASSVVENLNIFDVVRARRIVSQLAIYHKPGGKEIAAYPLGSRFEELYVAGRKIDVELDLDTFTANPSWSALQKHLRSSRELQDDLKRRWGWSGPECVTQPREDPESPVIMSLVRRASGCPGTPATPVYVIPVKGFGKVFLAELLMSRNARRLTMVRLELGSPVEGKMSFGGAEGNGSMHPI
ncbi:MAG: hypothetical protein H7039_11735 [Bryobacteraceae bacterium]|nr:hypothetical protein [Bryobacteraceae bacterium]